MATRKKRNSVSAKSFSNMTPSQQHQTPGTAMVWTTEAVEASDFLVFRDAATDKIQNVIAPNGLQVGLFDANFLADLNVTGRITGSGQAYFNDSVTARLGYTGSLQKLTDGSNYLVAGSNVTVTNNANGSISIAANAAATTANDLTVGPGLRFNAGSTFDGSAAKTISVDINSQTQVTPATGDFVLIHDVTDGALKKVTVNDIQSVNGIDISGLQNTLTDTTIDKDDLFAVADVNAFNDEVKKITLQDISERQSSLSNSGIANSYERFYIKPSSLDTMSATIDPAADTLIMDDVNDGTFIAKKTTIASVVDVIRGTPASTGLNSTSGVLSVDINALTTATPAASDQLMIYDADATALKKIPFSSIGGAPTDAEYVVLSTNNTLSNETVLAAGDGLDLTNATFSLDLKSSGGLKITSTELEVEPADFAGSGLEDDGSDNLRISAAAAGNGLSGGGGVPLAVQYGTTAKSAVRGDTTAQINAGYGLNGGLSSTALGLGFNTTLDVEPEDFAGTGVSVSSNNINTYLSASSNITITTGSDSHLAIALNDGLVVSNVISPGLTGSLTKLADGSDYLRAGTNISLTTGSNASVTISSAEYIPGDGLDLTGLTFSLDLKNGGGLKIDSTELAIDDSKVATLTGSVFSGAVRAPALTGSLTKLNDGTSYIIAGPNITVATGSSGAITISATSAGGGAVGTITQVTAGTGLSGGGTSGNVTVSADDSIVATLTGSVFSGTVKAPALSGSLTKLSNGDDYITAGAGIVLVTGSNGAITISTDIAAGTIGNPEDGTYGDGVFTDFTANTLTGTAVDRFNELLKALAPSPAPDLDNIDCINAAGVTALLSFGAANDQSSATPAYVSSNTAAGFAAVNVNGSYSASTADANIRKGIYDGTKIVSGTLNQDVAQNAHNTGVVNFVADSFGNANIGTLQLHVNGSQVHSVNLTEAAAGAGVPGSGTANKVNSNGSGFFELSQTGSAVQSTGTAFTAFQHRTGKFKVAPADQRNGWNYAQVIHALPAGNIVTNFVEWVNDSNNDNLTIAGNSATFTGSGSIHLSGVEYFQSGTLVYKSRVSNAYKYIYDNNPISFPTSDTSFSKSGLTFSLANQAKPTIDTGNGENHAKVLHLTASATLNANYFLDGNITAGTSITHPLKNNLTNSGQSAANQILLYNLTNNSTALQETFRRENFRIVSGSYDTQASIVDAANAWKSTTYITASNGGHSDGLQFFNERLLSPKNTVFGGNFSNFANGPAENPNYSAVSGTKTFFRWFKNETGSTQYDFSLLINGTGTIVTEGTALTGDKISVLVRRPPATGYMDLASPFVLDSFGDTAGAHVANGVISFDNTLDATNYVNFGNVGIADDEYVVIKIIADANWTGNISNITVAYGAGSGTLTPVPNLDDIDVDQDGADANLSFGSSKTIAGYANPTTGAGFTAADVNSIYQTAENNNNLRAAVFNGSVTIEGDLNADVTSPGNDFFDRTFSDANSGSLKLEVNGAVIHTVAITGTQTALGSAAPPNGNGTSVNSDGSGFGSISRWEPGLFDNGVPRYSEIQRSAKYKIVPASQRPGWNYARVIHTVGGSDRTTNYVEWVNDADSNALSGSDSISVFGDDSFSYLSGVKYFNSPSGSLQSEIHHIYKNVYSDSNSAISFTGLTNATAAKIVQAGAGLSSTKTTNAATDSLQTLATSANSQNQILQVSGTINFTRTGSLPGTYTDAHNCGGRMVFDHPLKTNLTTTSQIKTNLLVWTPSDTSNANTDEQFTGEAYRLVSGSYTAQTDISGGTKAWNSQRSMNDQGSFPEHATGLLIYDTYLIPPKDGGASGDFRNHTEGGGIESPLGNVNYSSGVLTNANRDYYRSFLNNTTNDLPSINITIYGDATLVASSGVINNGALGSNKNVFVDVAIPGKTGFLDLAKPSAGSGNVSTGDGALSGDIDASIDSNGATNRCTFNGAAVDGTVSGAEYIVLRVTASKNWTGYIDRIAVNWS